MTAPGWLILFVVESNRIEGITRNPTDAEIDAHVEFLASSATDRDLEQFVGTVEPGSRLREYPGQNVRVGRHIAPPGGPDIRSTLNRLLAQKTGLSPYTLHCQYEYLHPFTDGNGRSGRVLWLWTMQRRPIAESAMMERLRFLHTFYYQALEHYRGDSV